MSLVEGLFALVSALLIVMLYDCIRNIRVNTLMLRDVHSITEELLRNSRRNN